MKTYLTFFTLIIIFFMSSFTATSQETDKKKEQEEYAIKKRKLADSQKNALSVEDVAKKQTENLRNLLKLDDTQTTRVYEICFQIEEEMNKLSVSSEGEIKTEEINKIEDVKDAKMKETLTEDQFKIYLNTVKNKKR